MEREPKRLCKSSSEYPRSTGQDVLASGSYRKFSKEFIAKVLKGGKEVKYGPLQPVFDKADDLLASPVEKKLFCFLYADRSFYLTRRS
jgi:hypothetical protein